MVNIDRIKRQRVWQGDYVGTYSDGQTISAPLSPIIIIIPHHSTIIAHYRSYLGRFVRKFSVAK